MERGSGELPYSILSSDYVTISILRREECNYVARNLINYRTEIAYVPYYCKTDVCSNNVVLQNDLSQEKRYRHLLSTVATTTKIAICSALCCEGSPTVCNVQYLEEGYICRPCHRSGQKLHNTHAKLATARQQFRDAVSPQFIMNAHCPLSNPPPISSTTPNPKRLRLESHTGDTSTTPVKVNKYHNAVGISIDPVFLL